MRSSVVALSVLLAAAPAAAHFKLVAPAATLEQEPLGDPQKDPPCGGVGTATNAVTTVRTGSTLTITISETIFHPGHYRVALAQTEAELPPPPTVTGAQCGMAAIDPNPALPVLADGKLVHTSAFSGQQSFDVQLPAGMECENCVLQVLEFMSNHAAPCFYHHCATVTISNDAPLPPDAGTGATPDSGTGGGGNDDLEGGCCGVGGGDTGGWLLALGVGALLARRRGATSAAKLHA
ncbi:MAG TPA: SCE4755 family polysaccharide monooxygenase-like protein [Kofleriaceae bacterium]|jgi:hypothetical protein|nr:SCE4755 family polysaccharide monooxygenase-like protein [Kofleriaceae bacterium]